MKLKREALQKTAINAGLILFLPNMTCKSHVKLIETNNSLDKDDFEPLAWLKATIEKLPTNPNSRIDELPPLCTNNSIQD